MTAAVITHPPLSEDEARRLREAAAATRVLVVGSLNVDMILKCDREPGDEGAVVVREVAHEPGGHAGNCASALAGLGVRVSIAAAVGADADGDLLLDDLRTRGVDTDHVTRVPATPTGRVVIPVFGESHYMLLCRGANEAFTAADVRAALAAGFDAVMLFDPSRDALLETVRAVRRSPDPPRLFWTPGGVYAGEAIVTDVAPQCDVLLLNRREYRDVHARIPGLGTGPRGPEVVVTLGGGGSLVCAGGVESRTAAPEVCVVDPTGAGDAFAAAYLLASQAGLAPSARLVTANVSGALAVTAIGARGRQATLADLVNRNG